MTSLTTRLPSRQLILTAGTVAAAAAVVVAAVVDRYCLSDKAS